ncbi:MAG: hypothetical protein L7U25_05375, partial [Candidatus Poseidonia sp.]|nr:hypothetical protein [Poseidonia sp.]
LPPLGSRTAPPRCSHMAWHPVIASGARSQPHAVRPYVGGLHALVPVLAVRHRVPRQFLHHRELA